ncbi:MAG: isochorismatase family protein [Sphingorhabdus sp.]
MNRFLEKLTADNSAMLLIDHQTGTMLGVQDIRLDQFRSNVLALAETAKVHSLPTVLTASYAEGPNGPLMPELLEMFPDVAPVYRPGPIDAWDDPNFVTAVEATGRKKLIMAGVTSDVCMYYPAISALAAGYDVWCVYDASGAWDMMSQLTTCMRLVQAGAIVVNWAVVCAMLQADWRNATAEGTLGVFGQHLPFYGMLANNQRAAVAQQA